MSRLTRFAFQLWCCFVLMMCLPALPAMAQSTVYDDPNCTQNGGDRSCIQAAQVVDAELWWTASVPGLPQKDITQWTGPIRTDCEGAFVGVTSCTFSGATASDPVNVIWAWTFFDTYGCNNPPTNNVCVQSGVRTYALQGTYACPAGTTPIPYNKCQSLVTCPT